MLLKYVILFNSISFLIGKEYFTSISHLYFLVYSSVELKKELENYLTKNYELNENINKALSKIEQLNIKATRDVNKFIRNPINCFLLIKQLTYDIEEMLKNVFMTKNLENFLKNLKLKYKIPSADDYEGAVLAIYRLQEAYQIDSVTIQNGKLNKNYPSRKLTSLECVQIASLAHRHEYYEFSIDWLRTALNALEKEPKPSIDKKHILKLLFEAYNKSKDLTQAHQVLINLIELVPDDKKLKKELKNLEILINSNQTIIPVYKKMFPESAQKFFNLCRQNEVIEKTSLLKCRYFHQDSFLIIRPIKQEELSLDPYVVIFYNLINKKQASNLKKMSFFRLNTSLVMNEKTGTEFSQFSIRSSKVGWVRDEENSDLNYLSNLIKALTGLNVSMSEEWQVSNYGISGHYGPHYDFFLENSQNYAYKNKFGNRIATWMLYLEAPEYGGNTVFTNLGLSIKPLNYSAVFWYNMHKNGSADYRTLHGGCPVLIGSKWIANKWIGFKGQEFTRKCDTRPDL